MSESTALPVEFNQVGLSAELLSSLTEAGYKQMTPVQAESLPAVLKGDDVVVQAETGSGKTAVFALGLLSKLTAKAFSVQALVLCPTRELAEQVAGEIRILAKAMANIKVLTLCGGEPIRSQIASLQHGAHILVGTPGRILDHIQQHQLDLTELTTLVLDEADRMLDMGFADQLKIVIDSLPASRQNLMFSATYPAGIAALTQKVSQNPLHIKVEATRAVSNIEQRFYTLGNLAVPSALMQVLDANQPESCIIFCNTKREVKQVADALKSNGYSVLPLHGDLEQRDRDQTIVQFSNASARILVATDLAARGLDIEALDLVLCVNLAHDVATHTHRVGRTGRAGEQGLAISLVGTEDDYKLRLLEDSLIESGAQPIQLQPVPEHSAQKPLQAKMITVQLNGGKKDKLRPGDIVGALTRDNALSMDDIGKIKIQSKWAFVAIRREVADRALKLFNGDKIKGKRFRAQLL